MFWVENIFHPTKMDVGIGLRRKLTDWSTIPDNPTREIECRWSQQNEPDDKHRFNTVSQSSFYNVKDTLDKIHEVIISNTIDYSYTVTSFIQGKKTTSRFIKTINDGEIGYRKKTQLDSYLVGQYEISFSLNKEETILRHHFETFTKNVSPVVRRKNRFTYNINGTKVELTIVSQQETNFPPRYEVEAELTNQDVNNYLAQVEMVLKLVQGTLLTYTVSRMNKTDKILLEKPKLFTWLNKVLGRQPLEYSLAPKTVEKPVNLEWENITIALMDYHLTNKTDGRHKLLVYTLDAVWLVFAHEQPNKIFNIKDLPPETFNVYKKELAWSVLDGELLTPESYTVPYTGTLNYIWYDTLASTGSNVFDQTWTERMEMGQSLVRLHNQFFSSVLRAIKKIVLPLKQPVGHTVYGGINTKVSTFVSAVNAVYKTHIDFDLMTDGPNGSIIGYKTDGLIFIPDTPYRNDPIYKWKPFDQMTIDFRVDKTNTDITLSLPDDRGNFVEFTGSNKYPYNKTLDKESFNHVVNGGFAECTPYRTNGDIGFKFLRSREKTNSLQNGIRTWNYLHKPIGIEDLTDRSFNLTRMDHRGIKRRLFNGTLFKGSLLDLGIGNGGTLKELTEYRVIFGVDPDQENLTRCQSRWNRMRLNSNETELKLRKDKGENYSGILEWIRKNGYPTVSVVSMMLSLTFFFSSRDKLLSLCRTISGALGIGGEFIFLTVNGNGIHNFFTQFGSNRVENFNGVNMIYHPDSKGGSLEIAIGDTIVRGQLEYLVDINLLERVMVANGFVLEWVQQQNFNGFLGPNEKMWSNLHSFGRFVKVTDMEMFVEPDISEMYGYDSERPVIELSEFVATGKVVDGGPIEGDPDAIVDTISEPALEKEPVGKKLKEESKIESTLPTTLSGPKEVEKKKSILKKPKTSVKKTEPILPMDEKQELKIEPIPEKEKSESTPESKSSEPTLSVKNITEPEVPEKPLPIIASLPPDDTLEISINDHPGYYRIGAIADGTCWFHAVLNSTAELYQNASLDEKKTMGTNFRYNIKKKLDNKFTTAETYWQAMSRITGVTDRENIVSLLSGQCFLGQEMLVLTAMLIGRHIIVVGETDHGVKDIKGMSTLVVPDLKFLKGIILFFTGNHYESVGKMEEGTIKTVFSRKELNQLM